MKNLKDKTAVIVGGTGDIGLATAKLFAASGAEVVITGRKLPRAEERAKLAGDGVRGVSVNPSDEQDLNQLFNGIGKFEFLILTLGTQSLTLPFAQLTDADYQKAIEEKFFFYIRSLRAAMNYVQESVTWLTGAAGRCAVPGLSNYGATCGALHGALPALTMELAPLRLNCVAAGVTKTDFWNKLNLSKEAQTELYADAAQIAPAGVVAEPEDIADSLYFAATNRYTTGTILDTSGGLRLGRSMGSDKKVGLGAQTTRPPAK